MSSTLRDRRSFEGRGESSDRVSDVHRVFQEFADGTSMHGVPRIINARSIPARFFWSVICMGAFGMFLWQCGILLERYFSYPKKVVVEIVQRPVPFPSVSVCNTDMLNLLVADQMTKDLIKDTASSSVHEDYEPRAKVDYEDPPWDSEMTYDELPPGVDLSDPGFDTYDYGAGSNVSLHPNLTSDQSAFVNNYFKGYSAQMTMFLMAYEQNIEAQVSQNIKDVFSRVGLVANMGPELASAGSIDLSDFIISCRFMDRKCNASTSFEKVFDPYFYNCFTFQPDTILESRASRLQGVEYGLTLLLFTNSAGQVSSGGFDEEEMFFVPGLQESDSALASGQGVRLVIHPPHTRPQPTADGYDIPPGFSVTMGVKARENVRIKHPHGNCSEAGKVPDEEDDGSGNSSNKHKYRYTLVDCQNECIQRTIMDTCKCVDNRLITVDNPLNLPYCFKIPMSLSDECLTKLAMSQHLSLSESDECMKQFREYVKRIDCRKEVYERMTIRDPDSMNKCDCYPPCSDIIYDASYSLSMLPERTPAHSSFYSNVYKFIENLSEARKDVLERNLGPDYFNALVNRTIRLNVHISDSIIIKTTESPDYEAIRLVSDIGGQLGLWIGISVMTIFEVLQLVADIFRFLTAKSRNVGELRKQNLNDNMRNNRYGNGDGYIRPSYLDPEYCEIDKLTTV